MYIQLIQYKNMNLTFVSDTGALEPLRPPWEALVNSFVSSSSQGDKH